MLSFLTTVRFFTFFSAVLAYDPVCPVALDGRVPGSAQLSSFDRGGFPNPFNPTYVRPSSLRWSQILKFPAVPPSLFELTNGRPIELTISEKSIYQSQTGLRRSCLLLAANSGTDDATNAGVKTFHWSVGQTQKPLNLNHEYLNVWHETSDYKGFQFQFMTGALIQKPNEAPVNFWKFLDRRGNIIWAEEMYMNGWQNYAVTLDFIRKYVRLPSLLSVILLFAFPGPQNFHAKLIPYSSTIQIYSSRDQDELRPKTAVLFNDNSGKGRFELGITRKGTGQVRDDLKEGFHENKFEESQIYGGIFVEDSSRDGCITK
jgi:hypothetical protein